MSQRRKIPPDDFTAQVLTMSRRRCCICFALDNDDTEKSGQIVHLDHDSANSTVDNLAFLCLPHHDRYDTRTSQSKGFTIDEVKRYRTELYAYVASSLFVRTAKQEDPEPTGEAEERHRDLVKKVKTYVSGIGYDLPSDRRGFDVLGRELDFYWGYVYCVAACDANDTVAASKVRNFRDRLERFYEGLGEDCFGNTPPIKAVFAHTGKLSDKVADIVQGFEPSIDFMHF